MVDKISMVRHDLTLGKRPGSPKKMEKYSSTDGSLTPAKEVKPAKTMKEEFSLGFNKLYYSIMQEAADPNAAPPAPPAPPAAPADPAAAGAPPPPADPNAVPPPPGEEGEGSDEGLDGGAGMGLVGKVEESYQALVSAMESVQDEQVKEQLKGVKDNLSSIFETLTGAGFPDEETGAEGGEEGAPGAVPNMEQTPPDQAGVDPNAAPPPPPPAG